MGKIYLVAVAIVILTASWVGAGNFEILADAGIVRAPTPLQVKPGTVVKAEFKSNMTTSSDVEADSDNLVPERVAAKHEPKVSARSAIAMKERAGSMAPPPRMGAGSESRVGAMAESTTDSSDADMESDLEKDLVISPPSPRAEQGEKREAKPQEKKPVQQKAVTSEKAAQKKKSAPAVKRMTPADYDQQVVAGAPKPIRKVRPLTGNPWSHPAGTHGNRNAYAKPESLRADPGRANTAGYAPMSPPYMASQPRRMSPPQSPDRIVRDGVTIKLAPAAAPADYAYQDSDENQDPDIFSAAAEILGMPFAFISSFF